MNDVVTEEFNTLRLNAIHQGAEDARLVAVDDIVVGEWTRWKCMYGCPNYGKILMCPPYTPTPDQTRSLLKSYNYALILKYGSDANYHDLLLNLERQAFLAGQYSVLAMTGGSCHLCEKCDSVRGLCVYPKKARPSMEGCGIDVFETARKAGFSMNVKTSQDQGYSRFCLLLLK